MGPLGSLLRALVGFDYEPVIATDLSPQKRLVAGLAQGVCVEHEVERHGDYHDEYQQNEGPRLPWSSRERLDACEGPTWIQQYPFKGVLFVVGVSVWFLHGGSD